MANFLNGKKSLNRTSDDFGQAFEHWIAMELRAFMSYQRIKETLCYWRTTNKIEVDFIIGNEVGIEVKATTRVTDKHLKGLRILSEEGILKQLFVVSFDEVERETREGIRVVHWKTFIRELWEGKIVKKKVIS